jgi:hypothetical protein
VAKKSPSAQAMAHLAELGYTPWVVERNITPIIKRDLFNCIDILGINAEGATIAVQVTSGPNHAARATKVRESDYIGLMLKAGWLVEVWSYKGALLRREQITL